MKDRRGEHRAREPMGAFGGDRVPIAASQPEVMLEVIVFIALARFSHPN
ncbi:MAG: hypothetical protein ACXIVF_13445 [Rhizobiaceae bacterium]